MKFIKYILIVLIVIIAGLFIVKELEDNEFAIKNVTRELCYIWNTEAGDSATLRMAITNGTEVAGSFNFVPAEKDKKTGPIEGTAGPVDPKAMARTAKLWWIASGEGVTNKEELSVIFGDGIANPGFGEMKDRGDGVYVYANPDEISYSLQLQQTGCDDPAVK